MGFEHLDESIKMKMRSCETPEELLSAASEYGVEFSEEELAMISGGGGSFKSAKEVMFPINLKPEERGYAAEYPIRTH